MHDIVALKVESQGQTSLKSNYLQGRRNTYSNQVTSISDQQFLSFCADSPTDTHRRLVNIGE